jgi:hypothetical protein
MYCNDSRKTLARYTDWIHLAQDMEPWQALVNMVTTKVSERTVIILCFPFE